MTGQIEVRLTQVDSGELVQLYTYSPGVTVGRVLDDAGIDSDEVKVSINGNTVTPDTALATDTSLIITREGFKNAY